MPCNCNHVKPLRVIINGDVVLNAFEVDITTSTTVEDLRNAIKANISRDIKFSKSTLRDIAIEWLQLWRVILPIPDSREEYDALGEAVVHLDSIKTKRQLGLTEGIVDVFSGANNGAPAAGI
ncbi:hypothetical protein BGW39_011376, partial [Mortierella sp. 14UC]